MVALLQPACSLLPHHFTFFCHPPNKIRMPKFFTLQTGNLNAKICAVPANENVVCHGACMVLKQVATILPPAHKYIFYIFSICYDASDSTMGNKEFTFARCGKKPKTFSSEFDCHIYKLRLPAPVMVTTWNANIQCGSLIKLR